MGRVIVAVAVAATLFLGQPAAQPTLSEMWDLWMIPMPLGHELDLQRNVATGAWAAFWLRADGASAKLAGGR
jgi:hypothetical protein